ncbi:MAG: cation:proton antiporter [Deltaproteobacteria bacterium]|nr:cation:proton antiporter [Deltaproteobacteria bacterium]
MSAHGAAPSVQELVRGVVALACVVGVRLLLERIGVPGSAGPLFALGFLVVAGYVCGGIAAFLRLPRLTGYLLAGLAAGPQGAGLIDSHDVKALMLVNTLALALIALQAGAEITLPVLRRSWWSVSASALAQLAIVIPGVGLAFWGLSSTLPFTEGLSTTGMLVVALLWGTLAFTRSPSVTIAVLAETRAKGPLTDWSIGIVVLLDVLILPIFAIVLGVTKSELVGDELHLDMLATLGHELFSSVAAGVTLGLAVGALLRFVDRERVLVLVVFSYGVTALCTYLGYDTLFVFVIAGFVVMNLTRSGAPLMSATESTSGIVMIVFFATAGAKLDLAALYALWPAVLALVVARVVASVIAARVGHALAKDPAPVRSNAWLVLVSQAGVTIGLATIIADSLPGVGSGFASLCIAVVALNTIVGAALTKWALARAGEIPQDAPGHDKPEHA